MANDNGDHTAGSSMTPEELLAYFGGKLSLSEAHTERDIYPELLTRLYDGYKTGNKAELDRLLADRIKGKSINENLLLHLHALEQEYLQDMLAQLSTIASLAMLRVEHVLKMYPDALDNDENPMGLDVGAHILLIHGIASEAEEIKALLRTELPAFLSNQFKNIEDLKKNIAEHAAPKEQLVFTQDNLSPEQIEMEFLDLGVNSGELATAFNTLMQDRAVWGAELLIYLYALDYVLPEQGIQATGDAIEKFRQRALAYCEKTIPLIAKYKKFHTYFYEEAADNASELLARPVVDIGWENEDFIGPQIIRRVHVDDLEFDLEGLPEPEPDFLKTALQTVQLEHEMDVTSFMSEDQVRAVMLKHTSAQSEMIQSLIELAQNTLERVRLTAAIAALSSEELAVKAENEMQRDFRFATNLVNEIGAFIADTGQTNEHFVSLQQSQNHSADLVANLDIREAYARHVADNINQDAAPVEYADDEIASQLYDNVRSLRVQRQTLFISAHQAAERYERTIDDYFNAKAQTSLRHLDADNPSTFDGVEDRVQELINDRNHINAMLQDSIRPLIPERILIPV